MKTAWKMVSLLIKIAPLQFILIFALTILIGAAQGFFFSININLFSAIEAAAKGEAGYAKILLPCALIGIISIAQYAYMNSEEYINSLIEKHLRVFLLGKLHDTANRTRLEAFEDHTFYDALQQAQIAIKENKFMDLSKFLTTIPMFIAAILSSILVISSYNAVLMLVVIISVIPFFISKRMSGKEYFNLRQALAGQQRRTEYYRGLMVGKLSNRDARCYGIKGFFFEKYRLSRDIEFTQSLALERKQFQRGVALESVRYLGLAVAVIMVVYLIVNNQIVIGSFIALTMALMQFQELLSDLMTNLSVAVNSIPFGANVFGFLQKHKPHSNQEHNVALQKPLTKIELRNVRFAYPGSVNEVIKGINLTINRGDKIALLGYNGAGKSTLIKLILGLYEPTGGEIFYNEISGRLLDKESIWAACSAVFQDFNKYYMSIRNNVSIANTQASLDDTQLEAALDKAGFEMDNQNINQGLDTMLGREFLGTDLSGGQWQRLCIARAYARDYSLIVLDEPTAAIDPIQEAEIFSKFFTLAKDDALTIIVSHRIGSAKLANRILVVEDGLIIEDGTHETLMEKQGRYYDLFTTQSYWYQR